MVKVCVAGKCSKTAGENVSLHYFPKDEPRRTKWIKFVQNTRYGIKDKNKKLKGVDWTPSSTSTLCSNHFMDSDFIEGKIPKKLKPGTFPKSESQKSKLEHTKSSSYRRRDQP
ncbi:unnamed protein product, partial [Meganyctiphanes norvegica]